MFEMLESKSLYQIQVYVEKLEAEILTHIDVLERTEIKLREACQRLGERNRHLEALKQKADIWRRPSDGRLITVSMGKPTPGGWFNKLKESE